MVRIDRPTGTDPKPIFEGVNIEPGNGGGARLPEKVEIVAASIWTIANVLLALALAVVLVVASLNVDVCGPSHPCNFTMNFASQIMMPIAAGASLVITIVLAIVFARTRRRIWLAPAFGCAFVILVFVVALILNTVAVA